MKTLRVRLDTPWDAVWLAETYPHIFRPIPGDEWTVEVYDVRELMKLSGVAGSVRISWEDDGFNLCVFSGRSPLVRA